MIPAIPEDATVLTEKEAAEALKKFVRKIGVLLRAGDSPFRASWTMFQPPRNSDRSKFMSLPTRPRCLLQFGCRGQGVGVWKGVEIEVLCGRETNGGWWPGLKSKASLPELLGWRHFGLAEAF
eukprot:s922_g2.t1